METTCCIICLPVLPGIGGDASSKRSDILRKRMSYQTHTWIHNGTGISRQPFKSMYGIRSTKICFFSVSTPTMCLTLKVL